MGQFWKNVYRAGPHFTPGVYAGDALTKPVDR